MKKESLSQENRTEVHSSKQTRIAVYLDRCSLQQEQKAEVSAPQAAAGEYSHISASTMASSRKKEIPT